MSKTDRIEVIDSIKDLKSRCFGTIKKDSESGNFFADNQSEGRSPVRIHDSESGQFPFSCHPALDAGSIGEPHRPANRGDSESGRSMVEMLGTLAIMGVLAIGGIAGYRFAMDKYRANDTIQELTRRAVVYGQQMNAGATTLSSGEFNPANATKHGYGLTAAIDPNQSSLFKISLTDVPEEVCQAIVNTSWSLPVGLSVNDKADLMENVICAVGANKMDFTFHKDLNNSKAIEESPKPTDPETPEPPAEEIRLCSPSGGCYSCDDVGTNDNGIFLGTDEAAYNACHSCSGENQRFMNNDSWCQKCEIPQDTSGYTTNVEPDECHRCNQGNNKNFIDNWGNCFPCYFPYEVSDVEDSECTTACAGTAHKREIDADGKCALKDCPFQGGDGKCYTCAYPYGISGVDADECVNACAGTDYEREMSGDSCVLKSKNANCTTNQFKTVDGCQACSSTSRHYTDAEQCHGCPNSQKRFITKSGSCYACSSSYNAFDVDANECHRCDGDQKRFMDKLDWCYACSSYNSISYVDVDECARCDAASGYEREVNSSGYCVLKTCDGFRNTSGSCYPCSTSYGVSNVDADECVDACKGSGYEREVDSSGYCVLKNCDGFRDKYGYCYPCSYSSSVPAVDADECAQCADTSTPRYISGGSCYKCPTNKSSLNQTLCESCKGTWNSSTSTCS